MYLFGRIWLSRLGSEALQVCVEPAIDWDPAKTNAKGCGSMQYINYFIEKITEYSLLLQHLSIYYNDNHSLSDVYCPFVVPKSPLRFLQPSTTINLASS